MNEDGGRDIIDLRKSIISLMVVCAGTGKANELVIGFSLIPRGS